MSKERLFEDFPPVTDEEWRAVVERDLKGADYEKKLVWRSHAGLSVQPFYRRTDLEKLDYLTTQAPGSFPYVRGKKTNDNRWLVCQPITRHKPVEANESARKALATGAEALSFRSVVCAGRLHDQRVTTLDDFEKLLSGIDLSEVPLHFDWSEATPQAGAYLVTACKRRGVPTSAVSGSLEFDPLGVISATGQAPADLEAYWDRVAAYLKEARTALPNVKHLILHTNVYVDAGSSLPQDLAFVLSQAVEILSALTDRGFDAREVLQLMGVKVSVGGSYFMEIAFFRALRLLWAQMAQAFGASGEGAQLWIHAETCALNKTVYDAQVNILRQTTETMSAVIGGVDVMSVPPWDDARGTATVASERLARNTQLVIREETGLDHAVDASAGSFYIETLTDGMAAKAWDAFQTLERAGGYLAALEAGTISEWIAASRAVLDKGVASRRTTLLGTNQFPNAQERMAAHVHRDEGLALTEGQLAPGPSSFEDMVARASVQLPFGDPFLGNTRKIAPVPARHRLAKVYEDLRLRVEGLAKTPGVYLWTFGSLAFRKARAGFCYNLYACAGFEMMEGKGSTNLEENFSNIEKLGATWVVFCSSDEEYPVEVPALVAALKKRFPDIVPVVAGYPQDALDALQAAGVQDFVHLKTEAVSYLTQCVQLVGGER